MESPPLALYKRFTDLDMKCERYNVADDRTSCDRVDGFTRCRTVDAGAGVSLHRQVVRRLPLRRRQEVRETDETRRGEECSAGRRKPRTVAAVRFGRPPAVAVKDFAMYKHGARKIRRSLRRKRRFS